MKYAFIQEHRAELTLSGMYRVLDVHRSGFYVWLLEPLSARAVENQALTAQIKEFYDQSMGIYGSPRVPLAHDSLMVSLPPTTGSEFLSACK